MHPAIKELLGFFETDHLAPHLVPVGEMFASLAIYVAAGHGCAETTVALRKLLEAKNAAVRAAVLQHKADAERRATDGGPSNIVIRDDELEGDKP